MKHLLALIFLLFSSSAFAATAFVDGTLASQCGGNYSKASRNCSGSDGNAFPTIAAGVAAMSASDTLYVRTGTYVEAITSPPSGVSGLPTSVAGCPATVCATQETPILQSGSGTNEGINTVSRTYQTFRNFKISFCSYAAAAGTGISLNSSTNIIAEDIEIDGCAASAPPSGFGGGVYTYHSTPSTFTNNILRRLYVHDIGGSATAGQRHHPIYINSRGVTVEHSRIENGCNYSIHAYDSGSNSDDTTIRYNKIHADGFVATHPLCSPPNQNTAAILVYGSRSIIHNNQITGGADKCISVVRGSSVFIYNNSCRDTGPFSNYGIEVSGDVSGAAVRNNALQNAGTIQFDGSGSSSENRCDSISKHCQNTLTPGFTSTTDLTLVTGSGLIDGGRSLIGTIPGGATVTALGNGPLPDIGAFESIPFASASATTTSVLDITFGAAFAPLSTVSSCANVTVRQAGATKTCSTFANNGNATYRWTCAACLSSGGGTIDIAIAAGKFTDSIAISGSLNQPSFALPVTTVTNNISGVTEVFTSRHFRQRTWARAVTDTIAPAWIKAEDAAGTVRVDNGKLSAWWLIDCTVANCPSVGFQFEANLNGGAYANVTDSCVTNPTCFDSTNSAAPHGTVIPSVQLTDSLGNYLAGAVAAQASGYPVVDLALNQSTQIQGNFAIKSGLVAGTDVVCIRPKLDSGAAVTHTQTLCVNVVNPAGSPA